jgi:membrane-associated phospholipid phosphatase
MPIQRVHTLWLVAICQLLPATGHSQTRRDQAAPEHPLWRESWPTVSWLEAGATVAAGAGTLVLALRGPSERARWQGGILFDGDVRDALRAESKSGRQRARSVGDLTYFAAPVIPLLIDPLIAWGRGDGKAARNVAWIGLEAFSYSGLLSFASTSISARARPDSAECLARHPDGSGCSADTQSFWSGHSTITATSAGIVCANHRYMPLWGHPVADFSACMVAAGSALTTAISRVAADRHYASDVLVGMGVGFGVGYAVPVLLHYSHAPSGLTVAMAPCSGQCLSLSGSF